MKPKLAQKIKLAALAMSLAAFAPTLLAQLSIPFNDGSDGVLNITNNTVIDLRLAVTGNWTNNNAANAGKGIYDPTQWAVVFKYSAVTISSNATVSFINHSAHAPVVWLVSGSVTNNGVLSLDSQAGGAVSFDNLTLLEPGPGGFRGGARAQSALSQGGGFGPGGSRQNEGPAHGVYTITGLAYGNPQIIPLIGGSGGSSWDGDAGVNGGAGGGAILIAAAGSITVAASGLISADGQNNHSGFFGSGGAIRLVANQIQGSGRIEATSAAYPGRIRLEANTTSGALSLNPATIAVAPSPLIIFPDPATAPTVRVVSVGGLAPPADPKAAMLASGDDLTFTTTNVVSILLQTVNFPTNGTVNVYFKPRNGAQSTLQASYLSGNTNLATWQLNTLLPLSHVVIQARAVAP